ncbi:hypothetical protein [Longimicrobium sp.]|uniref:hypothetical protein n=1 Tax=Longimicrobium sp. TaxID=2029185 RepID=UPI002E32D035|nr:hypothetical protein [Longimicrobium sp.]HEX6042427.1 hypothetical protein [Longimicrobium sp.]
MKIHPAAASLILLAACAPRVYHREAQRPVAAAADAYACATREARRLGYELRSPLPGESFSAARVRPGPADARYPVYDYLVVEILDGEGSAPVLRVGAVTLAGGDGGVRPHFRAPLPATEADRDALLDACAPAA